jgi:hypothetical protein
MSSKNRAAQKLISFVDNPTDLERIKKDMDDGWNIISLVRNTNWYVGIMEKAPSNDDVPTEDKTVFIPPRKKFKISY